MTQATETEPLLQPTGKKNGLGSLSVHSPLKSDDLLQNEKLFVSVYDYGHDSYAAESETRKQHAFNAGVAVCMTAYGELLAQHFVDYFNSLFVLPKASLEKSSDTI